MTVYPTGLGTATVIRATVDMSADYCRLAEWRTNDRDQLAKVLGIAKSTPVHTDEQPLFDLDGSGA